MEQTRVPEQIDERFTLLTVRRIVAPEFSGPWFFDRQICTGRNL